MNADEWRHVDQIFNEALDKQQGERARFIEEACAGNASLQKEVEALLAAHGQAGRFLESGAEKAVARPGIAIPAGTRLGPYEILAAIGAGGMGEVYKAHDSRLQRDVAVKVLKRVVSDGGAWSRFQREARASSALTHPNICMIHDVGDAEGQPYLVMELLEGVTLTTHIGNKPLKTQAVIAIAVQIAEAIEAAHAKGIIHRDIKPANVMITDRGRVKVLDFGLAKQSAMAEHLDPATLDSVTVTGTVTGTPPYLSPEVLQGARADVRSDLWAFGVLLYQMLTGRLPFTGATVFELSSAILKDPMPPLSASVPSGLRAIVERCLAKRPEDRYQSAAELRAALEAIQKRPPLVGGISRRALLGSAVAAAVTAVAAGGTLWQLWKKEYFWKNPLPIKTFEPLTDFPGDEYAAAISPDGKFAMYIRDLDGQLDAWVIQIGAGVKPRNVTKGQYQLALEGRNFRACGFSGKGDQVWFMNNPTPQPVESYLAPLGDGEPHKFVPDVSLAWSPIGDSKLVYHKNGGGDPIFIADYDGTNPRQIVVGGPGVHCHFPIWSLDGRFIYFVKGIIATGDMDIWRIEANGTASERITSHNAPITHPDWLDSRTLIYIVMAEDSSEQRLYAIDVERRNPHPVLVDAQYLSVAISNSSPRRLIATRSSKAIATLHTLAISDRPQTWNDVRSFDAHSLNSRVRSPRFAPALVAGGSDSLLFLSSKGGRDELWKLEGETATRLWDSSDGGGIVAPPAISGDGKWICFSIRRHGRSGLYVMDSKGGPPQALAESLDIRGAASWSPDGKSVVVAANQRDEGTRVFNVPIDPGGKPVRLVDSPSYHPLWSPDGALILYSEPPGGPVTTIKAVTPNRKSVSLPAPSKNLYGNPGIAYRFVPGRKAIVVLWVDKPTSRQCFDSVDLETGQTVQLAQLEVGPRIHNFDVSSDGRQIIFDRVQDNGDIVWMDLPS